MTISGRTIIASLASPIAILIVPTTLAFLTAFTGLGNTPDPMDDAPQQASVLFLFFVAPIAYPILAIIVFFLTLLMQKLGLFVKKIMAASVLVPSVLLAVAIGVQSPFGTRDQLIGVAIFFCLFAFSLGLGAVVLWLLAPKEHNLG